MSAVIPQATRFVWNRTTHVVIIAIQIAVPIMERITSWKKKPNSFIMNHVKLQYVFTQVWGSGTNQHYWIILENVGIKMEYNIIIWECYKLLLSKIQNKVLILTCFDLFLLLIFWFKESLSKKPDGVDKPQKWKKSKPS